MNILMKLIKNRTKNWKTTLVGFILLIIVFILVFMGKTNLTESFTLIIVALSLLLSNDTLFLKNFLPNNEQIKKEESKNESDEH